MALTAQQRTWLKEKFSAQVSFSEPMSRHTALRIGGPVEAYVTPGGFDDLRAVVKWAYQARIPYLIIGKGTNILVKDQGLQGLAIDLTQIPQHLKVLETGDDQTLVGARAGVPLQRMCQFAIKNSLAGINFALGIPGTVGGGIKMNAGTKHGSLADVIFSVTLLRPDGGIEVVPRSELEFGYRKFAWLKEKRFSFMNPAVILEGAFGLSPGRKSTLEKEARQILQQRKAAQPVEQLSAGSFFKNPVNGKPAGELIELAGLKEKTIGGAKISAKHANFIINTGHATAADILALMELVRKTVFQKFEIELEPEVKIVG